MELVKENKYYVYALIDPINRLPFYIGKGCGNRAWSHLKNEKTNIEKVRIIGLIRSLNLEPEVKLITSDLEETLAYQLETLFIDYSKSIGIKLVNVFSKATPPSRRGCIVSDITKQKISNTTKGRKGTPMTDIAKLKLSIANTGKQGPNKAFVDIVNLHNLYVIENKTKKEEMKYEENYTLWLLWGIIFFVASQALSVRKIADFKLPFIFTKKNK